MKRLPFLILTLLFLISCQFFQSDSTEEEAVPEAPAPVRSTTVDGFVVQTQPLERIINATGSLLPNELVQISPQRAGKLVALYFEESSFVKQGALLAQIDDSELSAQLDKLKVQLQMAVTDEQRGQELRKIDAIPQDEYDRLKNTLEQIQADIKLTEVQLAQTRVTAPFSGLIGLRNISLGAYVTPSQSIVELQQINPLKLEFDVPERYMQEIRKGQKVSFSIVGFDTPFTATIYATAVEVAPSTRSFKVRARCSNPNGLLKPGNFAKVDVITGINENAMMVPSDAVIPVIDGQKVFVKKQGVVEERNVKTGLREGVMIEITSGIEAGDTVIVSGLLSLSGGMPVSVGELVEYNAYLD